MKKIVFILLFLLFSMKFFLYSTNFSSPSFGVIESLANKIKIRWNMPVTPLDKRVTLFYDNNNDNSYKIKLADLTFTSSEINGIYEWNDLVYSGVYTIIMEYYNGIDTTLIKSLPISIYNYNDTATLINSTRKLYLNEKSVVIDNSDINNDGLEDLVVTGTMEVNEYADLLSEVTTPEYWEYGLQKKDGTFENFVITKIDDNSVVGGIKVEDLDLDNKKDIIIAVTKVNIFPFPTSSCYIYCYMQTGNLSFTQTKINLPVVGFTLPLATELETIDFNGDSLPDLAVLQYDFFDTTMAGKLHIYIQQSDNSFKEAVVGGYNTPPAAYRLTIGDYNNDYKNDIAVVCKYSDKIRFFFQGNSGNISGSYDILMSGNPITLRNLYLNSDDKIDFAVTLKNENKIKFYVQQNDTFLFQSEIETLKQPQGLSVYDFNIDGLTDLAVTCESEHDSGYLSIYKNIGDTFIFSDSFIFDGIPLDLTVFKNFSYNRPSLAVMNYEKKIFINDVIPVNSAPNFISNNIDVFEDTICFSEKIFDINNDIVNIDFFVDTDDIGFDGIFVNDSICQIPYDTVSFILNLKNNSLLSDTFYVYFIITDGNDSNAEYRNQVFNVKRENTDTSGLLFSTDLKWSAYEFSDTGILGLNIITSDSLELVILINNKEVTDTILSGSDTYYEEIVFFEDGYNEILIFAKSENGETQIEEIKVLRDFKVDTEKNYIFNTITEENYSYEDSGSFSLDIVFDTVSYKFDTEVLHIENNFNDSRLITIIKSDSFVIPSIPTKYEFVDSFVYDIYSGKTYDTTIKGVIDTGSYLEINFDSKIYNDFYLFFYDYENDTFLIFDTSTKFSFSEKSYFSFLKLKPKPLFSDSEIIIYPNPWIPDDGKDYTGTLNSGVYLRNLYSGDIIEVYNLNAELIKKIQFAKSTDYYNWDCKDKKNKFISSGVYFILVKGNNRKSIKKFMVVR